MSKRAAFALLLLLSCSRAAQADDKAGGAYIPAGDPVEGRKAFIRLNCIACHAVTGDPALKAPWSASPAPLLHDPLKKRSAGSILDSILLPSHRAAGKDLPGGETSPMGSFFPHAMTVAELLDIAAYLTEGPAGSTDGSPQN